MASQPPQTEIYTVQLPDGSEVDIEGPAGADEAQLQAFVQSQGIDLGAGGAAPMPQEQVDRSAPIAMADTSPGTAVLSTENKTVTSPYLQRYGAELGRMIASGVPDAQINQFLQQTGAPVGELNIGQALAFRNTPQFAEWKRQNPGKAYPINPEMTVPLNAEERAGAELRASPVINAVGSAAAGAADTMSLGFFDEAASLVDPDFQQKQDLAAEDSRLAYTLGQIGGGLGLPSGAMQAGSAAARAAIRQGLGREAAVAAARQAIVRRSAAEGAAYGGAYGAGSADGDIADRAAGAIVGALAGGAIGAGLPLAVQGAQRAGGAINNAVRPVLDAVTTQGARNRAAGIIERNAVRPIGEILQDIRSREVPVSGAQPTLAEVAGDTGIAGLQRGIANTSGVENAAIAERQAQNAILRTRAASETMGDGSPQAVQDLAQSEVARAEQMTAQQQAQRAAELEQQYAARQDIARRQTEQARGTLSRATERMGPVSDRDASGSSAREAFDTAYESMKGRTREAYNAPVLQNPQPITLPKALADDVRSAADAFYGDGGGTMPEAMRTIINDMFERGTTTRTLTNIDRRLADFAGEARMSGRNSEAAFAERIRSDLGAAANRVAPQEYRDALAAAKAVRAEQGRIFESGAAAPAFRRDRFNNPVVGNTEVPGRLVRPGAPGGSSVDGLIQAVGPDTAERITREELRRVVEDAAVQTEAQARRLAVRYTEAAKRFPSVAQDLEELQAHARALDAAAEAEAVAGRARPGADEVARVQERAALHEEILASPLAKIADAARDPGEFIASLVRRPDKGRSLSALWRRIGDNEEAQAGFRRSLGDFIEKAGEGPNVTAAGDNIPSINKTRRAISMVVGRAGDALSREQKIVLSRVSRELEQANFAATAGKPAGSETAMNAAYAGVIGKIPFAGKAVSMMQLVVKAMSNQQEVNRLLRTAILDPDFAADLLKRPTPAHISRVNAKLARSGVIIPFTAPVGSRIEGALSGSAPMRAAADESGNGSFGVPQDQGDQGQQYPQELPQ